MVSVPEVNLNSGKAIPTIGLGFWLTPEDQAANIAYEGLNAGYRLLDSARIYKNEQGVINGIARWLAEDPEHRHRGDVFYTTKIYDTEHGYSETKAALNNSIEKAKKIGYIDLVLVHSPQSNYEKRHGTWMALQEAVDSGKVKSIGVSNYGIKHIKELLAYPDLKFKPVINQLELHPWLTRTKLVEFSKSQGIAIEAYSPLTHGKKLNDPDLVRLGKKYSKSPAQILIRWSLDKGFIPLPKTVHTARLAPNLDVFDFNLTNDEVKLLDQKDEDLKFCWDPTVYPLDNEKREDA